MAAYDDHEAKLWHIIETECDGSRMNNSKWMEMFDALRGLPLLYRVKYLDWSKVSGWTLIQAGSHSGLPPATFEGPSTPTSVLAVEWLEIGPPMTNGAVWTDVTGEVEQRLRSLHVPYTWEGPYIRVIGHVRRNAT